MNNRVYLLWFVQERDERDDIELLIGIFATEDEARNAIERRKDTPGFKDFPEGFEIHETELGVEGWTDGFIED